MASCFATFPNAVQFLYESLLEDHFKKVRQYMRPSLRLDNVLQETGRSIVFYPL